MSGLMLSLSNKTICVITYHWKKIINNFQDFFEEKFGSFPSSIQNVKIIILHTFCVLTLFFYKIKSKKMSVNCEFLH